MATARKQRVERLNSQRLGEQVLEAVESARGNEAAYTLTGRYSVERTELAVGASVEGNAAALVLNLPGARSLEYSTRGLSVRCLRKVVVTFERAFEANDVIVLECLDASLTVPFCSLLTALHQCLARSAARHHAAALRHELNRWAALFAARDGKDEREQIGLWGELWTIAHASDVSRMVEAWRGHEGGTADFFRSGKSLEVKTSTRPGVHHISYNQAYLERGAGYLLSLAVERSSAGTSCVDLLQRIAAALPEPATLYERLAESGTSLTMLDTSKGYDLAIRPALFSMRDVPKVTGHDPGVSNLRYRIDLDFSRALDGRTAKQALRTFGLELTR